MTILVTGGAGYIGSHVSVALMARDHDVLIADTIGSEQGYTVLEMVQAFEDATGTPVPWEAGPRRAGDVEAIWASGRLARCLLGWHPQRPLAQMCCDALRWRRYALTLSAEHAT